jgi:glycerol uptake facilitator-like aquaporin
MDLNGNFDEIKLPCSPKNIGVMINMFVAEAIGTFTLCGVILSQKYNNDAPGTYKAFAVGLTLTCAALTIGGVSGGCLNPAVGLVQTFFQSIMFNPRFEYGSLPVYILGPLMGGVLAGLKGKLDEAATPKKNLIN